KGEYDEEDVFSRYAVWARSGPKDIGSTIAAALLRARSVDEARALAHAYHESSGGMSAGNGSLMRTAPLALRYRNDAGALERISREESSITHYDPLAGDACAWFNLTVAALVRGRKPPRSTSAAATAAEEAIGASEEVLAAEAQERMGFVLTALRIGFAAAFGRPDVESASCSRSISAATPTRTAPSPARSPGPATARRRSRPAGSSRCSPTSVSAASPTGS